MGKLRNAGARTAPRGSSGHLAHSGARTIWAVVGRRTDSAAGVTALIRRWNGVDGPAASTDSR